MGRAEELFELAKDIERHLSRETNDALAMEASSLFIQEFIRGRSGAYGDLPGALLWGVWPRHPYDDAVLRLGNLFSRCLAEGGSMRRAVDAAVESRVEMAPSDEGFLRAAAMKAVRDAAAEAIGGTARAWAHDVHWDAAAFGSAMKAFEGERMRRIEAGNHAAQMPLDACGGVQCCLDLAAFLFSTHYEISPWTPAEDGPFMWRKEDYERFVRAIECEGSDEDSMRTFAELVSNALLAKEQGDAFLHPCLFRDPFELALAEALRLAPGVDAAVRKDADAGAFAHEAVLLHGRAFELADCLHDSVRPRFEEFAAELESCEEAGGIFEALALLTFACCLATGREEARGYCARRLGIPKNLS